MDKMKTAEVTSDEQLDEFRTDNDSAKQLIALIDFELSRIDAIDSRAGVTNWALKGALGALVWLLLSELHSSSMDWASVAFAFVAVTLLEDLGRFLLVLLSPKLESIRVKSRYFRVSDLGAVRFRLLLECAKTLAIMGAITMIYPIVPGWSYWVLFCYFGVVFLLTLISFLISFVDWHVPVNGVERFSSASSISLVLITTVGLIGLASSTIGSHITLQSSEVKVGLLLWAFVMVGLLLSSETNPNPLATRLRRVRRQIGLGSINVEIAKKEVEIALGGLAVSDVLREEVDQVVTYWKRAIESYDISIQAYSMVILGLSGVNRVDLDCKKEIETLKFLEESMEEAIRSDNRAFGDFEAVIGVVKRLYKKRDQLVAISKLTGIGVRAELEHLDDQFGGLQRMFFERRDEILRRRHEVKISLEDYRRTIESYGRL